MTLSTTPNPPTATDIDELASTLRGRVVRPGEPDYDAYRGLAMGGVDPHPPAIVRVADAADVATVVTFARARDIELAVRSGGHSGAAHSTTDRGLVIDLRELTAFDIDLADRSVWAGAGLTAGAFTVAAAEHGLATGFGDTGSVGIGGITLGGGIGYLVRKFGMTIDALLAAELVTADGTVRMVDDTTDPELFWALRGGGGNFGVVTRFRYRLRELPSVVGGMLLLPATVETISGFMRAAAAAPDELSAIANVMPCPPMPFVPEERHGELMIMALMTYAGENEAGQAALAPFRALAEPVADMLRPMSYPEMYPPEDDSYHPMAEARTLFMDSVDAAAAAIILEHLEASDAPMRVAQLRPLGGAMARVPAEATAFAHRDRRVMANVAAFYEGPEDRPAKRAWVEGFAAAIRQGRPGAYVNFLVDEGEARVHDAYPDATWDRLAVVKARVDPENLFHRNQNIPPAGASAGGSGSGG